MGGEGRGREKERLNIDVREPHGLVALPYCTLMRGRMRGERGWGTNLQHRCVPFSRNQTHNLWVCGPMLYHRATLARASSIFLINNLTEFRWAI